MTPAISSAAMRAAAWTSVFVVALLAGLAIFLR